MNVKRGLVWLLVMLVLLSASVSAKSMKLLAVSETSTGLVGTTADLELDIKEGSGRVFISTFPLTNVDTQISFRMAKEYACDFLDRDCSGYDFYYVVRSDSPIIGGPSAGGAATLLTISTLDNLDINPKVAATGTINSGGILGPVAGVKQKIEAASKAGLTQVLIPLGTRYYKEDSEDIALRIESGELSNLTAGQILNQTTDLVEYGKSIGVDVEEVEDITEAISYLTGRQYEGYDDNVVMDDKYQHIMKGISENLCGRSRSLGEGLASKDISKYSAIIESAENLTASGSAAYDSGMYYSSASYCYGANVKYDYVTLIIENPTEEQILEKLEIVQNESDSMSARLDTFEYTTIDDMQTFLVVQERLAESQTYIDDSRQYLSLSKADSLYSLSLAVERLYSAYYWSDFFGQGSQTFDIQNDTLERFCLEKISEADERIQYISSYLLLPMDSLTSELDLAMDDYRANNYEMCIFKASKVKARTNLILNSIGLRDEDFERVLQRKIEIAGSAIVKETERDIFPILGYSYYEYAKSLQYEDPSSAMLYAELSLELSNFDMYFKQQKNPGLLAGVDHEFIITFAGGVAAGFLVATLIYVVIARKYPLKKGKKTSPRQKKQRTKR